MMKIIKRYFLLGMLGMSGGGPLFAEDIEIYVGNESFRQGTNAKVMIIFDNSGSMLNEETVKKSYNPSKTYSLSDFGDFTSDAIYFSRGGEGVPKVHNPSQRFHKDLLSCETAWEKLRTVGFYTGYLREYQVKGSSGSWEPLPSSMGIDTTFTIDCYDDIVNSNPKNGRYGALGERSSIPDDRYPINGSGNAKTNLIDTAYTKNKALALSQGSALQGGQPVTIYLSNYIKYFHSTEAQIGTTKKTRLDIAKETINILLTATPGVDFGMMVFNLNAPYEGDRNGGRIVNGIKTTTDSARAALLETLSDIDANTNTPLCETLMEAKRYYAGENVVYGDDDSDRGSYKANRPPRDSSIESDSRYTTPYDTCSDVVYTILITDGVPTVDNSADLAIKSLNSTAPFKINKNTVSYLPVLAEWMFKEDINKNLPGKQNARLYTIGFGQDAVNNAGQLLSKAAELGGGKYYAAQNSVALATALQSSLSDILEISSSFTSPSVASNNFDRTRSLDSVYYAMFLPDAGTRWSGNLKKLKLKGDVIVDKNDVPALDNTGSISAGAVTYWNSSNAADGGSVGEGGVLAQLRAQAERRFLVDVGAALKPLETASFSDALLSSLLGGTAQEREKHLKWAVGQDVDDDNNNNNTTEKRADLMGDPLHSKPLVLSYGSSDTRVLIGTNHGFLHMFKDKGDTVEESWAYMPQELIRNIPELRRNQNGNPKVYGVDGVPVSFFKDSNGNGKVDGDDKVWVFFGLRRGGNSYYALDLTIPDDPKLMWRIDSNTNGFAELAQSWSTPVVTYIEAHGDKPVLIFGAGFSTNKDSRTPTGVDNEGRGVFIVDAQTGQLIKAIGSNGEHSVAAAVSILDSDYDGFTDRLYFADTGGNIWRSDLVGTETSNWSVFKFAALGGVTAEDDRRFFNEPVVARAIMRQVEDVTTTIDGETTTITTRADAPFDAIVIGSGSRPHPLYNGSNDMLFMLRDLNTVTRTFTVDDTPEPITLNDLFQITDTSPRSTREQMEELQKDLTATKGWYFPLSSSEKSLSSALVLSGIAFFTSYIPNVESNEESCSLSTGEGRLYSFSLNYGILTTKITTTTTIRDTPEIVITECVGEDCLKPCEGNHCGTPPGQIKILDPEPVAARCEGDNCELIPELPPESGNRPFRQYILIDENF